MRPNRSKQFQLTQLLMSCQTGNKYRVCFEKAYGNDMARGPDSWAVLGPMTFSSNFSRRSFPCHIISNICRSRLLLEFLEMQIPVVSGDASSQFLVYKWGKLPGAEPCRGRYATLVTASPVIVLFCLDIMLCFDGGGLLNIHESSMKSMKSCLLWSNSDRYGLTLFPLGPYFQCSWGATRPPSNLQYISLVIQSHSRTIRAHVCAQTGIS